MRMGQPGRRMGEERRKTVMVAAAATGREAEEECERSSSNAPTEKSVIPCTVDIILENRGHYKQ